MIAIKKSSAVPEKLQQKQAEIATDLFVKKGTFKWQTEHYSTPIKTDLKKLYNNKCGYCEVRLTDKKLDNEFTVEHYRPKSEKMYYWLGAEWTNLFPVCTKCNNLKGSEFEVSGGRFKRNPFDENGKLISDYCRADSKHLKAERPLYFHPEIDNFEDFFDVEVSGKVVLNETKIEVEIDKNYLKSRFNKTKKLINNPSAEERRKKKIETAQESLERILENAHPYLVAGVTKMHIELLFLDFFTDLKENQQPEAEFSLLGKCMVRDFERFFIEGLEVIQGNENLKKLLRFLINNQSVEERQKLRILKMQKRLERILENGHPYLVAGVTKRDIELLFLDFFTDLKKNQQPEAEFSLLGKCMVRDFERFFIEDLDFVRKNEGLKKLLRFAYRLHFPKPI